MDSAQCFAMRKGSTPSYLLGDDPSVSLRTSLGSTSIITNTSGTLVSEMSYTSGTTPTQYQYTGQRNDSS